MGMTSDPTVAGELEELMAAIGGYDDPRRASAEWKQAYRLLQASDLPAASVGHIVGMRDLAGLAKLVEQLNAPAAPAPAAAETPSADACKRALKAFRKRLALTVLDEESKLGHGPLSKGRDASVAAIVPPNNWPQAVWQELVSQGKLRDIGHGFYELAE